MKYTVIYNPKSGLRKNRELETIEFYLKREKLEYEIHETTIDEGPYEILSKVNKDRIETIIACGGDGTVSQTIHGIHIFKIDCSLLILPLGTTNEIAQNLGLKEDSIENVLARLIDPEMFLYDYGLINDKKTFTYALTFGNFTQVTYETPQKMKNWLGYRAYILYGFLSFRKIKTYALSISTNDTTKSGKYLFGVSVILLPLAIYFTIIETPFR